MACQRKACRCLKLGGRGANVSHPLHCDAYVPEGTYSLHLHRDGTFELFFTKVGHFAVEVSKGTVTATGVVIEYNRAKHSTVAQDYVAAARVLAALFDSSQ